MRESSRIRTFDRTPNWTTLIYVKQGIVGGGFLINGWTREIYCTSRCCDLNLREGINSLMLCTCKNAPLCSVRAKDKNAKMPPLCSGSPLSFVLCLRAKMQICLLNALYVQRTKMLLYALYVQRTKDSNLREGVNSFMLCTCKIAVRSEQWTMYDNGAGCTQWLRTKQRWYRLFSFWGFICHTLPWPHSSQGNKQ